MSDLQYDPYDKEGRARIQQLFDSVVEVLKACLPEEDGTVSKTRCVVIVDDSKNKVAYITGLNASNDEARDIVLHAFKSLVGQQIASMEAQAEAKDSTIN